jgi:hypothetical protein
MAHKIDNAEASKLRGGGDRAEGHGEYKVYMRLSRLWAMQFMVELTGQGEGGEDSAWPQMSPGFEHLS